MCVLEKGIISKTNLYKKIYINTHTHTNKKHTEIDKTHAVLLNIFYIQFRVGLEILRVWFNNFLWKMRTV